MKERHRPQGGAQAEKRMYLNRCKDCGHTFETPFVGGKYCPACKKKRISAGQKARQKREHAAGPQENVTRRAEPEGAGEVENSSETVQEAWDRLGEPEAEANKPAPEPPDPADMETEEVVTRLADGMRKEPGDVALALYQAARDVARAAGIQTRILIETMYEIDQVLSHVGGV